MAEAAAGTNPRRRSRRSRWLRQLTDLWFDEAAPSLAGTYAQFGAGAPTKLQARLRKEIGYRMRIGRILPADHPSRIMGADVDACRAVVEELCQQQGDVVVLPDAGDRQIVGASAYHGANPPNPYQWVPVLDRHTKTGDIVWEMGPGVVASGGWVGEAMSRHVWLVQAPSPGSTTHEFRRPLPFEPGSLVERDPVMPMETGRPVADIDAVPPALILVPLPVPLDAFSIADFARFEAQLYRSGERAFGINAGQEWLDLHPELAVTEDAYLDAVVARLRTLDRLVGEHGTRVCVSSPMVKMTPGAVVTAIRKQLRWTVIERIHAFETHGARHAWNGTPVVGTSMTVWRAA